MNTDVINKCTHCTDKFLIGERVVPNTLSYNWTLDLFKEQIIGHVQDMYSVHADE